MGSDDELRFRAFYRIMLDELSEVVSSLENAFGVPEYHGELSKATLKGHDATRIIREAKERLRHLARHHPKSPDIPLLSAIASRYLGDESEYLKMLDVSLEIDPDHVETRIAKTDPTNYIDPFCYVSITDVLKNPSALRPISKVFLDIEGAYVDQARDGLQVKPVFFIRFESSARRPLPNPDMPWGFAAEICSVLPTSPGLPDDFQWPFGSSAERDRLAQPFLDVLSDKRDFTTVLALCPVLIDWPEDPFFKLIHINPSLFERSPQPPDDQPLKGRFLGLRLCASPHRTAVILLDEKNVPLLARKLDLLHLHSELIEIGRILGAWPMEVVSPAEWQRTKQAHTARFSYTIATSAGQTYRIPIDRTGNERVNVIFDLEYRDGKVGAKRTHPVGDDDEFRHDIFVSHSHDDRSTAHAVTQWLAEVYPELKVFMTSREQWELDEFFPDYYMLSLLASRALLVVVTENSLGSSHVKLELGTATQRGLKVVGLCAQRSTIEDLKASGLHSDFDSVIGLDEEKAESLLAESIRSALRLPATPKCDPGRLAALLERPPSIPDADQSAAAHDMLASIGRKLRDDEILSKEEALIWLDVLEKNVQNKARMAGEMPERLPRLSMQGRLSVLMSTSDETRYYKLLRPLASLVDEQFCSKLETAHSIAFKEGMAERVKYLKLLQCARKILRETNRRD